MVKIYKLQFTILQQEILRFLAVRAGESFNARRIAERLGVSQTAIAKALPGLKREGIIKVKKDSESRRLSIELNREGSRVISLKRVENLREVYDSGLASFLYNEFPGATIILFGSYSLGEDTTKSDIDIAVIEKGNKNKIILKSFEETLERKITLHFYRDLKNINKNLKENILNGIILKGGG